MEKLIIEENEFIEEEKYQRIKKEMNKKKWLFYSIWIWGFDTKTRRNLGERTMKKYVFLCFIM